MFESMGIHYDPNYPVIIQQIYVGAVVVFTGGMTIVGLIAGFWPRKH